MGDRVMHDASVGASVRVRVPAKINLFLAVRGLRPDGFHELVTVFQTLTLHDEVTATLIGEPFSRAHPAVRRFMELEFAHDAGSAVPDGDGNLAVRAAKALAASMGIGHANGSGPETRPVTQLSLRKHIPVAAGMAGGSADAAATLLALNELWECELTTTELRELAGELGADVPFCVSGGTALATGTGTATAQILCRGTYHWVVGITDQPLATPDVYRAWDEHLSPSEIDPDLVLHALRTADVEALGAALHNDLEEAAFNLLPDLREKRQAMLDAGALGAIVSGSGPTIIALAEDAAGAAAIAAGVAGLFDRVELARSPAGSPDVTVSRPH